MPLVSVVIPSYNVQAYLEQTLRNVLQQTFTDFEVLVIDDGSTDLTAEIARSVKDRRIRVISQANRGLAGARNTGIRAAKGEYIAFLDADDLWHREKLARHVLHLQSEPEVGVSYSQSAFIDNDGMPLGYLQTPKLCGIRAQDVFLRNPVGNGSAPVIRRMTLDEISYFSPKGARGELWYFDEEFRQSEDVECWIRIALQTHWRFEGIGMPLTYYRVAEGGLSANLDKQLASWERVLERVNTYAPFFAYRWGPVARGFQLRYLARRALRMGNAARAWRLLGQALSHHPSMLITDAPRTLSTIAAAALQSCVPRKLYARLEAFAMRLATRASPRVRTG